MPIGDCPLLSRDRLDYVDSTYETVVRRATSGDGMVVHHAVRGRNLVANFLKQGKAAFAVEISSPYATYREVRLADVSGEAEFTQEVSWSEDEVVPPVYVRPLAIAVLDRPVSVSLNGNHGVHELWKDVEVSVAPGAILAQDQFWRASTTFESLIRLVSNDTLPAGAYRVEMNTGEGLHFRVQMHPELYTWMVNPDARRHRDSILTGCLSRSLEIIRADYGGSDSWREFPVLRALHGMLQGNGLNTWEEGDAFHPDEIASRLKPLAFTALADE